MLPEFGALRDTMEQLFEDHFPRPWWYGYGERAKLPALDLYTTPESVVARLALPGVKPHDVDVQVADGTVSVTGTIADETETKEAGYVHRELVHGSFSRSFVIPVEVDPGRATAAFKDGLLTLTLPRVEAARPRKIKVEVK
jgi:HSP20 family protein